MLLSLTMSGFTINLDLTLYFDDLRKYACVFVDLTKCKEVSDVEKHVKSVFKLSDNICFTYKKYLIPSCEDIQILQQYETLKVQKCDFFDQQIHQNKQTKPSCDQAALNLIQSERTIDLSCRPKQRLKINICQSNCIPGTQLIPFVEGCKFQSTPRSSVSSNKATEEVPYIQPKESQKNKKKKCDAVKYDKDTTDGANGVGILDMSVKKSKRKRNDNVFSIDESLECDGIPASKVYSRRYVEIEEGSLCNKKLKKRKKLSEPSDLNEEFDLNSTWTNGFSDDVSSVRGGKKRKKKSKLNKSDTDNLATEITLRTEELLSCERLSFNSLGVSEEKLERKNHRKVCKNEEFRGKVSHQDSQKCSEKLLHNPLEVNTLGSEGNRLDVGEGSRVTTLNGKQYNQESSDRICNGIKESHTKTLVDQEECQYVEPPSLVDAENTNSTFSGEKSTTKDSSISELEGNASRKKRVRRHNKKQKRERKEFLLALGPVLKSLTAEQPKSTTTSSVNKHMYFTDGNFTGEVNSSSAIEQGNDVISQGVTGPVDGNPSQVITSQEEPNTAAVTRLEVPDKTETWQQEFLKLATPKSPLVFHRKIPPLYSAKTDISSDCSQNLIPESKPLLNQKEESLDTVKYTNGNCSTIGEAVEVNSREVSSITKETTAEVTQKLVDAVKPIPTDFENIVLTDYPIIDKVVAEDLILFKVLKLNENNQPGVSMTILGKVADTTSFPENICLQIIEGCEECRQFSGSPENTKDFMIDLRWRDILEPRLFYP